MNDGTMPTTDPVATPPVDNGMGAPAMDPPAMPAEPVMPVSDGGMGAAPAVDPATPPVDGGDMGAPEMPAPAMPAEGEAAPADDAPAPM